LPEEEDDIETDQNNPDDFGDAERQRFWVISLFVQVACFFSVSCVANCLSYD